MVLRCMVCIWIYRWHGVVKGPSEAFSKGNCIGVIASLHSAAPLVFWKKESQAQNLEGNDIAYSNGNIIRLKAPSAACETMASRMEKIIVFLWIIYSIQSLDSKHLKGGGRG